ncbi:MAG: NAD(P)-binding protein, partial [Candidatus Puniceispirillaceae bacterium]
MKAEIIIIGAGMAGLMAGRILSQAGREVLILDKGR